MIRTEHEALCGRPASNALRAEPLDSDRSTATVILASDGASGD